MYSKIILIKHTNIRMMDSASLYRFYVFSGIKDPCPLRKLYCLRKFRGNFPVDCGSLLTKDLGERVRFGAMDTEG